MQNFKFLNDNIKNDFLIPTEDEIVRALEIGRRAYLEGRSVDYNPFLRLELSDAFDEGWELEHSYDILRQSLQRAINGL
jgi:ribosome modulation factor